MVKLFGDGEVVRSVDVEPVVVEPINYAASFGFAVRMNDSTQLWTI